jgi:sigma-B regulation protein RsbU (phosphoserine phosphatase)
LSELGQAEDHKLWRILEVTRGLSAPTDLHELLEQVIEAARDVLRADRGTVFLYDSATDELFSTVATGSKEIRFPAKAGIAGECAQSRAIVNVPDCYADERFNQEIDRKTGYRTRCLLTVPLIGLDDSLVGVMQVLNKEGESPFDDSDEQLATALAAQCGVALQRARLLEEQLVKQKMERDLALAREIQAGVLPAVVPQVDGYEMAAWSESADETGGDIYDVIKLADGRVALLMGDATGHGIGPALSVTQVRAMLRMGTRLNGKLDDIFTHVNNQLTDDLPANRFVTAFIGVLEPGKNRVRYHAGGQGPLLHYKARTDECVWLEASTFPMGIMADIPLDSPSPIDLAPGDILGLLSDGIYEYADHGGRQFGEEGVGKVVRLHCGRPMTDLIQYLRDAVAAHACGAPQLDDMTIVLVKREA